MHRLSPLAATLGIFTMSSWPAAAAGQTSAKPAPVAISATFAADAGAPLPDAGALLKEVERNEEHMDALRNDYTYHVHLEQQRLRKDGSTKETEVTDSESLTLDGVRVDRVVARNGRPLTPDEQAKENTRLDKEVARAKERRAKALASGQTTDTRGDPVITVARLLELGSFSHERRIEYAGRPTIVLDYVGDPGAKTHSAAEAVIKDLVGTVWIDEGDRVLVRGQGHFLNDFKIGGGLLADVRKGSHFDFEAKRVNDAVWLPATIDGEGSVRILLLAGFNGQMHLATSDYRRFRTSATIVQRPTALKPLNNPAAIRPVTGASPAPTDGGSEPR